MELVGPIVEDAEKQLMAQIKKQIGYLIHLNSNIKNLEDKFQKLGRRRSELQFEIDIGEQNGERITFDVQSWVGKVDKIIEDLHRFLDEDVKANRMGLDGWCPNLRTRYSLSRKARKKTLEIDVLLLGGQFHRVSYPSPLPGMGFLTVKGIMDFKSRTKMMEEVLEALRLDMVDMIAICGMGGIGKTTMAKQVAKSAKNGRLFDEVAMAVVSQNQEPKNIQAQIAEMVGLNSLVAENLLVRAGQLRRRLMDSKSVLVILDDVWDALDLEALGIPRGGQNNRCKILLTSRNEEVCSQMKSKHIFKIDVLSEEEAWNLFREMACICLETPKIPSVAKDVARECGGLPVAIVTVGRALENKREYEWSAALHLLKNARPKNIPGLDQKAYSGIEFSYNYLKNEEAKSCFLQCCLFSKDYDIPIEDLVRYRVGQRLFAKVDSVADARNRVHAIVEYLKRSFLLVGSERGEQFVKMHDVVRDTALSIAENQGFLVRSDEKMEDWPEKESYECFTAISLAFGKLERHPYGLHCPKLQLLQLVCDFHSSQTPLLPPNLFNGMKGLKVLSLQETVPFYNLRMQSLLHSINVLENLRTLQVVNCMVIDVSAIGELKKLEILSFFGCIIKELPGEMRNLNHLKLLELRNCGYLERIPPGLLSSLSHLEELYVLGVAVMWKSMEEEEGKKGANASLTELMSLSYLSALKIEIPNIEVLPKDWPFKKEMIKFQIAANGPFEIGMNDIYLFENGLDLRGCDVSGILESQMLLQLLKKSEFLKLEKIEGLKNIVYELDKEGFQCLKVLEVAGCYDVEYVLDTTLDQNPCAAIPTLESLYLVVLPHLKEIYRSQFLERSFSGIHSQLAFGKLRSITLRLCRCLKNVFSLAIARGLVQLQKLHIEDSDGLEEIFLKEREDKMELNDMEIMFPQLADIFLFGVPRLIGFCIGVCPVELGQSSLNQKVGRIGTDEVTDLEKGKMTDIQHHTGPLLESITIISHKFFSSNTILWAANLEKLELWNADSLEVVFDLEEQRPNKDHQRIAVLARLKTLTLHNLFELKYVWKNVPLGIQGFQKLTSISVSDCHRLRYLFPTSIAKLLVELKLIWITSCVAIENIVQRDGEEEAMDIKDCSSVWPSIKEIYLSDCPKLKTIGIEIQSARKLKKINRVMDSRPIEQELGTPDFVWRCLECVPRCKNDGLMVVSDQRTTIKLQRGDSVKEEGTLGKLNDPKVGDSNNPSEIRSLFSSDIIECLKNLKLIELADVPSPEVLFQLEELNVEESHPALILDQLRRLELSRLDNLLHIWKKGPERILGFGNMRSLRVEECNSLTYLFRPSIAKLLVMLEVIIVIACEKVEEILARAGEEEEEKDVLFHKVNSISLHDLSNLKCFCNEANALVWPSLKEVIVDGCPSIVTFIPSNLNTPKLVGVYEEESWVEGRRRHWRGGLNATIEHVFKGKVISTA